jgi:hypothetical protein
MIAFLKNLIYNIFLIIYLTHYVYFFQSSTTATIKPNDCALPWA